MRTIRTEDDRGENLFFWNAKNAYAYIRAVCERGCVPGEPHPVVAAELECSGDRIGTAAAAAAFSTLEERWANESSQALWFGRPPSDSYALLLNWLAFAPVGSIEAGFYDIVWITILDDELLDSTGSQPDGVEIVDFKDGDFEDFMRSKGFVFIAEPQWISARRVEEET